MTEPETPVVPEVKVIEPKAAIRSLTIGGILTMLAGSVGVPAVDAKQTTVSLVVTALGALMALWGRYRRGDLKLLALAFLAVLSAGCAVPSANQGQQGQGGSTGPAPQYLVSFSFSGPVTVTSTSAPTAAPAATSGNEAKQDAKADGQLALGDSAIKSLLPVPKLPAVPEKKPDAPAPVAIPETPATPTPAPAPVVEPPH